MSTPRYSEQELWQKLSVLEGQKIWSLTGVSYHTIIALDDARKRYTIRYGESEKEILVRLGDVYTLYRELYRMGTLTNRYMAENCKRLLGRSEWRQPGSAMFAVLPHLDGSVKSMEGELHISEL